MFSFEAQAITQLKLPNEETTMNLDSKSNIDPGKVNFMLKDLFTEPREQISDAFKAILLLIEEQARNHDELRGEFRNEMQALRNVNERSLKLIHQLKEETQVRQRMIMLAEYFSHVFISFAYLWRVFSLYSSMFKDSTTAISPRQQHMNQIMSLTYQNS